jgi:hypothetical protein
VAAVEFPLINLNLLRLRIGMFSMKNEEN